MLLGLATKYAPKATFLPTWRLAPQTQKEPADTVVLQTTSTPPPPMSSTVTVSQPAQTTTAPTSVRTESIPTTGTNQTLSAKTSAVTIQEGDVPAPITDAPSTAAEDIVVEPVDAGVPSWMIVLLVAGVIYMATGKKSRKGKRRGR